MKWPLRPMTGRTREHEGPGRAASKLGHVQCRELRGGGGQEHSLRAMGTFANEPRGQEVVAIKQGSLLSAGPGSPLTVSTKTCN